MAKKIESSEPKKTDRYFEGVGRRKTAIARVRISKGNGSIVVNNKDPKEYFQFPALCQIISLPLEHCKLAGVYDLWVKVVGGGTHAQAEAVQLGLARALVRCDPELKHRLRGLGFLTRDSRMVERKKYGLKKARRAPQWKKR